MADKIQQLLKMAESDEKASSVSFAERRFSDDNQAKIAFAYFKAGILELDNWNNSSVITSFKLYDETGNHVKKQKIEENLLFRLSLKGSGKYDWVKIIEIYESPNEMVITVKPTHDPTDKDQDRAETSHFFIAESTNNFCLTADREIVKFYVIGLHEKQNIAESKNTLETVRNVITANVGSYLGIQKSEWTAFCKNFLDSYNSHD